MVLSIYVELDTNILIEYIISDEVPNIELGSEYRKGIKIYTVDHIIEEDCLGYDCIVYTYYLVIKE